MPTYSGLEFYDVDPRSIFSTATGGTATYTGPADADGTLTIFDAGSGAEGQVLTDDNRGEGGTTADASIGGNTSTGSDADAEEGWTLRDTVTGETFNNRAPGNRGRRCQRQLHPVRAAPRHRPHLRDAELRHPARNWATGPRSPTRISFLPTTCRTASSRAPPATT